MESPSTEIFFIAKLPLSALTKTAALGTIIHMLRRKSVVGFVCIITGLPGEHKAQILHFPGGNVTGSSGESQ